MLEVISLGAGVQSTTMALMAAHGEITPMPDAAIFADTGAEPRAVYEHLEWLRSPNVLPFPVHVVQWGNIREDIYATLRGENARGRKGGFLAAPFFTQNSDGSHGMLHRQCTKNYKIQVIRDETKRLLGIPEGKPARVRRGGGPLVSQWIGISADEWTRARKSREKWLVTRHPLIEDGRRMTRGHCLEWLREHDYPEPPRSACTFCPYRSNEEWRRLKADPRDWEDAVAIDNAIRNMPDSARAGLLLGGKLFLHQSRTPLADVDLTDPHEDQIDLWQNECEGMCGV